MRKLLSSFVILAVAIGAPMAAAQEPPETKPAPLTMASGGKDLELAFQVGAAGFGGLVIGGIDFIGGFNATLIYPIGDLFYAGIRPALHYVYSEDSDYETTWFGSTSSAPAVSPLPSTATCTRASPTDSAPPADWGCPGNPMGPGGCFASWASVTDRPAWIRACWCWMPMEIRNACQAQTMNALNTSARM